MRSSLLVLASLAAGGLALRDPLGPYNVNNNSVTVSGLSAGGFFAVQFHVAHSSIVSGAAVYAGGPYYCAQGSIITATTTCMNPLIEPAPSPQNLADFTYLAAVGQRIDDPSNLADDRVYIFSGLLDTVVKQNVVQTTEGYYRLFLNASAGAVVNTEYGLMAEHCLPTLNYGEACSQLGAPYLGNCNYDGAGAGLKTILGPGLKPNGTMVSANLLTFDQTKFGTGNSLGTQGYVYVPTACQAGASCSLHLSFHGCQQTVADVGDAFARYTGLNDWAEANNIIIVYPQITKSLLIPENPEGCWDWWGYAGGDYAYQSGAQISFVKAIIDYIRNDRPAPTATPAPTPAPGTNVCTAGPSCNVCAACCKDYIVTQKACDLCVSENCQ